MKYSSACAYLITVGFVSILSQVIILRELNVAFYGVELIYILALGFWMLGSAAGAAFGRRNRVPAERTVNALFVVTGAAILADVAFVRCLRKIFSGIPGAYLPFDLQVAGLVAATVVLSVLSGILFQFTARRFASEGGTLSQAYALESAGGVLGGLLSTVLLVVGFSNLSSALLCSAITVTLVLFFVSRQSRLRRKYLSIALLALLITSFVFVGRIDMWMTSWDHPDTIGTSDTPYGRVTVTSQREQVSVFENDVLSYETETTAAEEFVQVAALQAVKLQNVLVLGGGYQGIVQELLKLPVERIDYVEMNRRMVDAVNGLFLPDLRTAFEDKRLRVTYRDPRRFSGSSYDLILVAMSEPNSAQNNRFYTREFFKECSMKLEPGGVMAFRLPSSENLWTPELQKRNGSIFSALRSAFGHTMVVPGATDIFIASNAPLTNDPGILVQRLRDRNVRGRLVTPQYVDYVYTNDRFRTAEALLSRESMAPNSDIQPACYGYTISLWLSKFPGGFHLPDESTMRLSALLSSPVLWLVFAAVFLVIVLKRAAEARLFILMGVAGFVGMVSETILILNYQSKSGALYQDIGVLITAFMVGLALGASGVSRHLGHASACLKTYRLIEASFLVGLVIYNVAIYWMLKYGAPNGLVYTSVLLAISGALVSGVFSLASLVSIGGSQKIRTWLYSADLLGGCIGSLLATLFLLPVFGILTTSVLMAGLSASVLLFLR